jgi:predicted  nucleic acid-binding Zn-ribbon protein
MGSSKNQNNSHMPRIAKKILDQKADSSLVSILKQSFNQLEVENKKLKEENKMLEDTMQQMLKEAWKLKELVDKLREAIEEPVELKDK